MKITFNKLAGTFCTFALAILFVPNSTAQCGGYRNQLPTHTNWHPQFGQARLLQTAIVAEGEDDNVSIVGFWHVKFVSKGSAGIPDGAEVDADDDGHRVPGSGAPTAPPRNPVPDT